MNVLEYAEQTATATLEEARTTYDALHERAHKLVTLVAGGAGAAGVYALGKVGTAGTSMQLWPLGAVSVWWFGIAGVLLWRAATSLALTPGSTSAGIAQHFNRHFASITGDEAESKSLVLTRWDQLAAVDLQIESYCDGATKRANAIDGAYLALVLSPVVAAAGLLVARYLQGC